VQNVLAKGLIATTQPLGENYRRQRGMPVGIMCSLENPDVIPMKNDLHVPAGDLDP